MQVNVTILIFVVAEMAGIISASSLSTIGRHETWQQYQNVNRYVAALNDPARDEYQKPTEVLAALQIDSAEVIADIGAGLGYFSFRLAGLIGRQGHIYAIDTDAQMIRHLAEQISEQRLTNVTPILALPNDPLLIESVDRFLIVNTWHEIDNHPAYLARIREHLVRNGQVIMIDYFKRELPVGPPTENKIAKMDLIYQMQEAGFELSMEYTFLPYQYFLVFSDSTSSRTT
jgi:ubiquinone/menaquinone biosynthesis C-methylase UbiE